MDIIIILISNLICLAWAAEMPSREILIFSVWPEKTFSTYYLGLSLTQNNCTLAFIPEPEDNLTLTAA